MNIAELSKTICIWLLIDVFCASFSAQCLLPCFFIELCYTRVTIKMLISTLTVLVVTAMGVHSTTTSVCNARGGGFVDCRHQGLTSALISRGVQPVSVLDLAENKIQVLPEDLFDGIKQLTGLYLNNNKIKVLPFQIFNGLTRLENLFLQDNLLETLPVVIFDGLTRLTRLDIQRNQITSVPRGTFHSLQKLSNLYLNNNPLSSLQSDLVQSLPSLKFLNLKSTFVNLDCEGFNKTIQGDVCFGLSLATYKNSRLCDLPQPAGFLMGAGRGVDGKYRVARYSKGECLHGKTITSPYLYTCNAEGVFDAGSGPKCQVCAEGYFGIHCDKNCNCYNGAKCDHAHGTCLCRKGFNGTDCWEDTNECLQGHLCPQNSTCLNTYGSFKCLCEVRYIYAGGKCVLPGAPQPVTYSSAAVAGIVCGSAIAIVIVLTMFYKRNPASDQKEYVRNAVGKNKAGVDDSAAGLLNDAKSHELKSRGSVTAESADALLSVTLPHEHQSVGLLAQQDLKE